MNKKTVYYVKNVKQGRAREGAKLTEICSVSGLLKTANGR